MAKYGNRCVAHILDDGRQSTIEGRRRFGTQDQELRRPRASAIIQIILNKAWGEFMFG